MTTLDMIELELQKYIDDSDNLSRRDRLRHLMAIFKKHFDMEKTDHMMTYFDINQVIGSAKISFNDTNFPMIVSKKEMSLGEASHILMIESVLAHLNHNGLLRKTVKIDYKEK